MVYFIRPLLFLMVLLVFVSTCWAADERFDTEQMLDELEKEMQLSAEKLAKLKPALDAKSAELKKTIDESVEKGFIQIEEMNQKLDDVSKDAEKKVEQFLSSEEMAKLKDYLSKIDEDAIREAQAKIIADLTVLLELTEQQVAKLKPILEESMQDLEAILGKLARQGSGSLEKFKKEYEALSQKLRERLQEQLDDKQMEKLEKYDNERKDKIQQTLVIT